jgi:hypothetical protein
MVGDISANRLRVVGSLVAIGLYLGARSRQLPPQPARKCSSKTLARKSSIEHACHLPELTAPPPRAGVGHPATPGEVHPGRIHWAIITIPLKDRTV